MVDAVSLKLPTFWTNSPHAWFIHTEAQFIVRKITSDDTKYHYVVASLDSETANRALSFLTAPPDTDKFEELKLFLLSAYGLSESERATSLFNLSGLGDSKPTELMDRMLALLGVHQPCFLFKHLFLQQLPDFVRIPLSCSTQTDYRKLAQEADQLYSSGKCRQIQAIRPPKISHQPTTGYNSKRPQPSLRENCWYHFRFGEDAKRCIQPCSYSPSLQTQGNGQMGRR